MPSPAVKLHQIAYSEETWNLVAPGFVALDNRANQRPDWAEYWPIRNFLLKENSGDLLQEDTLYGFVSPRFAEKLHCNSSEILAFLESLDPGVEVAAFSPYFDLQAAFLNPFEQGEFFHPGLMDLGLRIVGEILPAIDPRTQLCPLEQVIYCNYFVAKPRFWRKWLEVCECIFTMAETPRHPCHAALNRSYAHRGTGQAKVFVIERIVSLLLVADGIRVTRFGPSSLSGAFPNIDPELYERMGQLKAEASEGKPGSLATFRAVQGELLHSEDARRERTRLIANSMEHGVLHAPSKGYELWGSAPARKLYAQKQISLWRLLQSILGGPM